jgi:hypothetical protein
MTVEDTFVREITVDEMYVNIMDVDEMVVDKMTRCVNANEIILDERTVYEIHDEMNIKCLFTKLRSKVCLQMIYLQMKCQ